MGGFCTAVKLSVLTESSLH